MVSAQVFGVRAVNADVDFEVAHLRALQRSARLHELILNLPRTRFIFLEERYAEPDTVVCIRVAQNAALVEFSQAITPELLGWLYPELRGLDAPWGVLRVRVPCALGMESTTLLLDVIRGRTESVPLTVITNEEPRGLRQYPKVQVCRAQ